MVSSSAFHFTGCFKLYSNVYFKFVAQQGFFLVHTMMSEKAQIF